METEFIVIINFDSKETGLNFMANSTHKFAFSANGKVYDYNGNIIILENYEEYKLNSIVLDINEKSGAGMLYVDNGLLKYFKEL